METLASAIQILNSCTHEEKVVHMKVINESADLPGAVGAIELLELNSDAANADGWITLSHDFLHCPVELFLLIIG